MNQQIELSPPFPFIREKLNERMVIPFLGSGASLSNRDFTLKWEKSSQFLPNTGELTEYLAEKSNYPRIESLQLTELTEVAQYFQVVTGREPLEDELHNIFSLQYQFSSIHRFLAEIQVPIIIITTNYDDLIEQAFDALGKKYDLIIHTNNSQLADRIYWKPYGEVEPQKIIPNKLDININTVSVIYKMHGAIDRKEKERDQYVITEDDYIDFLVKMNKNRAIPAILAEPFEKCHFLFLGYSLRDWNMRVVLNRIEHEAHRQKLKKSWAIQNNPSPLEKRFWQDRNVEVFDMTIEKFVEKLKQVD